MKIIKQFPNFLTLMNLSSGMLGIIFVLKGDPVTGIYLVFIAGLFDFLDGFAARFLNATSEIGKSLDSLADVISFGVLPGILAYHVLDTGSNKLPDFMAFTGMLIPFFSAIRLAVFHNDPEQKYNFRGLPTPANAIWVVSALFVYLSLENPSIIYTTGIIIIILSGCFLMVSRLKMFSLKINPKNKKEIWKTGTFILLSAILIILLGMGGVFLAIVVYIGFSAVSR